MARFTNVRTDNQTITAIQKLLQQNTLDGSSALSTNFNNFLKNTNSTPQDYNYSSILTDSGFGRLEAGLKSLELLGLLCSGALLNNLFLFDNVIYHGSVDKFQNATDDQLINLVIVNLGLDVVIATLSDRTTEDFRSVCLRMGRDVKVGVFDPAVYSSYILLNGKALVKIYLQIQKASL